MSNQKLPQSIRLIGLVIVALTVDMVSPWGHCDDGPKVRPRRDGKIAEESRVDRDRIDRDRERDRDRDRKDRFEANERRDLIEQRVEIPRGFNSKRDFDRFSSTCKSELKRAGFEDTHALLQGSAVTGRSFLTGKQFDIGRISDYDIALCSESMMKRASELGIEVRSEGGRTKPLDAAEVKKMGLESLSNRLSAETGRPVNFMVFRSPIFAAGRSPSIPVK